MRCRSCRRRVRIRLEFRADVARVFSKAGNRSFLGPQTPRAASRVTRLTSSTGRIEKSGLLGKSRGERPGRGFRGGAVRVLVTGAGGTLGGSIVGHLIEAGHEVVSLSRRPTSHRGLAQEFLADILKRLALSCAAPRENQACEPE